MSRDILNSSLKDKKSTSGSWRGAAPDATVSDLKRSVNGGRRPRGSRVRSPKSRISELALRW